MSLEVETPEPPDLSNRGTPAQLEAVESVGSRDQFRRDELESALRDGAWQEAFDEWSEYTDLTEEQFEAVRTHLREYDFFWDPEEERLRFTAPAVPETAVDEFDVDAGTVDGTLSDLGHTVLEMLQDLYSEYWDDDAEDVVWSEETFGQTRGEEEDRL